MMCIVSNTSQAASSQKHTKRVYSAMTTKRYTITSDALIDEVQYAVLLNIASVECQCAQVYRVTTFSAYNYHTHQLRSDAHKHQASWWEQRCSSDSKSCYPLFTAGGHEVEDTPTDDSCTSLEGVTIYHTHTAVHQHTAPASTVLQGPPAQL
eukprot:9834-Heterococcus_DN1.PRE.6